MGEGLFYGPWESKNHGTGEPDDHGKNKDGAWLVSLHMLMEDYLVLIFINEWQRTVDYGNISTQESPHA